MPVWHQVFTILMIYALKTRKFVAAFYALFPQKILDVKAESAKFFVFWNMGVFPIWALHSMSILSLGRNWHLMLDNFVWENVNLNFGPWDFRHPVSFIRDISPPLKSFSQLVGVIIVTLKADHATIGKCFSQLHQLERKQAPLFFFQKVSRFSPNNATVTGCGEENCQEFHFSDAGKPKSCWCRLKPQNTQ